MKSLERSCRGEDWCVVTSPEDDSMSWVSHLTLAENLLSSFSRGSVSPVHWTLLQCKSNSYVNKISITSFGIKRIFQRITNLYFFDFKFENMVPLNLVSIMKFSILDFRFPC